MYETIGEAAECYLDDVTKEHRGELDDLIQNWFIKHKYLPNWYNIYEIDEISVMERRKSDGVDCDRFEK